jgi:hypothetical protein
MIELERREFPFLHHRIEAEIEVAHVTAIPSVWCRTSVGPIVTDLAAARRTAPRHTGHFLWVRPPTVPEVAWTRLLEIDCRTTRIFGLERSWKQVVRFYKGPR